MGDHGVELAPGKSCLRQLTVKERTGFDIDLVRRATWFQLPVIAKRGMGTVDHFVRQLSRGATWVSMADVNLSV